jgi:hypothetical protein
MLEFYADPSNSSHRRRGHGSLARLGPLAGDCRSRVDIARRASELGLSS